LSLPVFMPRQHSLKTTCSGMASVVRCSRIAD
jgi:hypothetical protein